MHSYERFTEPLAGTVTFVPLVTVQEPPLSTASVTVTPVKATLFGFVTVIWPVTFQRLSVKPVWSTFTE